jgi:hypothetical protein
MIWREATMIPMGKLRTTEKNIIWICPKCGYQMSDLEMNHVRFDYGCPRDNVSFSEFNVRTMNPPDKRGETE